ncbi:MAG: O-methyltransferase [Anaerolineae bacterium]
MANQANRFSFYAGRLLEWAGDSIYRPKNFFTKFLTQMQTKLGRRFRESNAHTRRIDYNYNLLPNPYIAEQEAQTGSIDDVLAHTGYSVGYPAWNLLYYALYASLNFTDQRPPIIIETGTNQGYSTIVMAQVLHDLKINSKIITVEFDSATAEIARQNIEAAGLSEYVDLRVGDAVQFLRDFVATHDHIDFIFLDDDHSYEHVRREFDIIYKHVVACNGKVYMDNTASGGVGRALRYIRRAYGGNLVEFLNCSWGPPGNAIWQP